MTLAVVLVLAAALRYSLRGPQLRNRITVPAHVQMLLLWRDGATSCPCGVNAFVPGGKFGGWALIAGVAVGGVAAWRKVPLCW